MEATTLLNPSYGNGVAVDRDVSLTYKGVESSIRRKLKEEWLYDGVARNHNTGALRISKEIALTCPSGLPVRDAVFCPAGPKAGKMIATGSDDGVGRIWDLETGKIVAVLLGHTKRINSIRFTNCGRHVFTASDDVTIRMWYVGNIVGDDSDDSDDFPAPKPGEIPQISDDLHGGKRGGDEVVVAQPSPSITGRIPPKISFLTAEEFELKMKTNKCIRMSFQIVRDLQSHAQDGGDGADKQFAIMSTHGSYLTITKNRVGWGVPSWKILGKRRMWYAETNLPCPINPEPVQTTLRSVQAPDKYIGLDGTGMVLVSKENAVMFNFKLLKSKGFKDFTLGVHGIVDPLALALEDSKGCNATLVLEPGTTVGVIGDKDGPHGAVKMAEISYSGNYILSGAYDATLVLWDRWSGRRIKCFEHPMERRDLELHVVNAMATIDSVAFSPGDKFVASCSVINMTVRVFDIETGNLLHKMTSPGFPSGQFLTSPRFSPCGEHIACGDSDAVLHTFDLASGIAIQTFKGHTRSDDDKHNERTSRVNTIDFSDDGRHILSGGCDGTARVWDRETGLQLRRFGREENDDDVVCGFGHNGEVLRATFSPTNGLICDCVLTSSVDGTIRISPLLPSEPAVFHTASRYETTAIDSRKGLYTMASYSDGSLVVWDSITGEMLRYYETVDGFRESPFLASLDIDWGCTGLVVIGRRGSICAHGIFQIWMLDDIHPDSVEEQGYPYFIDRSKNNSLIKGKPKTVCSFNDGEYNINMADPTALVWTTTCLGDHVWTARTQNDHLIAQWQIANFSKELSAKKVRVFRGHTAKVNSINFTAEYGDLSKKNQMVTGSDDGTIRIWQLSNLDSKSKEVNDSIVLNGHNGQSVLSVKMAKNGWIVSGSSDCTAVVWNSSYEMVRRFSGHQKPVQGISLSGDGSLLFTGSDDHSLRVWDVRSGREMQCIPAPSNIRFLYWCGYTANLIVGIHCPNRSAVANSIISIPNASVLLETLTPGALQLAELVDIYDDDPSCRFKAVSDLISMSRPLPFSCWDSSIEYFCSLARSGKIIGLQKTIFNQNVLASFFSYSKLLTAAVDGRQVQVVDLVLNEFCKSVENHNAVGEGHEKQRLMLTGILTDITFVMRDAVIKAMKVYPDRVRDFLLKLPLLRASNAVNENFCQMATIQQNGMIIGPSQTSSPRMFWYNHERHGTISELGNTDGASVVETLVSPIAGLTAADSTFIEVLLNEYSSNFFGSVVVAATVRFKWRTFGRSLFLQEAAIFLVGLFLFITVSILTHEHQNKITDGSITGDSSRIAAMVLLVVCGLLSGQSFLQEVRELRGVLRAWHYFSDPFNAIFLVKNLTTLVAIVSYIARSETVFTESMSVGIFFWWISLFYYMQALRVGPVIRMIIDMVYDILDILLVFVVLLFAIANGLYVILMPTATASTVDTGFDTVQVALFTSYKLLLLGEFDDGAFIPEEDSHRRYIAIALFLVASLIGIVVLLNLVIARMGDSYERIQEEADEERLRLIARITYGFEKNFSKAARQDVTKFPSWLHILLPRGANTGKITKPEWAGLLSELRSTISGASANNNTNEQKVHLKNRGGKKSINLNEDLASKVENMEVKLDALASSVDRLMDRLDRV